MPEQEETLAQDAWPCGLLGPLYSGTETFLCEKTQKNSVKESQRA